MTVDRTILYRVPAERRWICVVPTKDGPCGVIVRATQAPEYRRHKGVRMTLKK